MTLWSRLKSPAQSSSPAAPLCVRLDDGREIPLVLRLSPRAKRLTLRFDTLHDQLVLVHPRSVAIRDLMAFAHEKRSWIARRIDAAPDRIPFADGSEIPIHGVSHRICHCPTARRGVWSENGVLHVSGDADFLARRVRDYLRRQADDIITEQALELAKQVDRSISRISLRDAGSRWGSCTSDGKLSFSWRLILAPPDVLSYVVAHEVSHLVELNHSARFWQVVRTLAGDTRPQRQWLRDHGRLLHRYD